MKWPCVLFALVACTRAHGPTTPSARGMPSPIVLGTCGQPGKDGKQVGASPRIDHADRDLDGDGRPETIVVDRSSCTSEGNCYWNVFTQPRDADDCARFIGTFEGRALEPLTSRGDENMTDVRAYWQQSGGRLLLQTYRFTHGGYQISDVVNCKRASDDRLECADTGR